jgi:3'-phosphoadenosine 5'-phosphosulfate sulfotransferase (PAPS reductase)/FAD synthetase
VNAAMEKVAAQAAQSLAGAPAQDVIAWAAETFGRKLCITSSMTDAVIIHLASQQVPGIDVLFLDTGYHFPETIGTRDAVSAVYPVNVVNVTPPTTVAEQDAGLGPRLYSRNPDLCCYLRKVVPLEQALLSNGRRTTSTTTSRRTACWSIPWFLTATRPSAAAPAPSRWRPARTRAAAAGPGRPRPSAGSTSERPAPPG